MRLLLQLCQEVRKHCTFCEILCYLILKMQLLCGCKIKKGVPIDCNMIREKTKSLYDSLKQNKVNNLKLDNSIPAKDSLIILKRDLA